MEGVISKTKTSKRTGALPTQNKSGFQSKFRSQNTQIPTKSFRLKEKQPTNVPCYEKSSIASKRVPPTISTSKLPKELTGRPKIMGNQGQLESLYDFTMTIAQKIFKKSQINFLFPSFFNIDSLSRQSFMSSQSRSSTLSTSSKIPILKRTSIVPDTNLTLEPTEEELSMQSAFKTLSTSFVKKQSDPAFAQFAVLYVSLVLSIGNPSAISNALSFLSDFLNAKTDVPPEVNILFAVLIRISESYPQTRPSVVNTLTQLASLDESLAERLENGSTHRDISLSSLCKDVLQNLGRTSTKQQEKFVEISESADINIALKLLGSYVDTLEDNGQPSDLIDFIKNIASVMIRFGDSAEVLEKAASCVESVIPFCAELPVEIVFNCLSLSFTILSGEVFLNGEHSFEAVESLQSLINAIFTNVSPAVLIPSVSSLIAQSQNSKLEMVINHFDQYCKAHPDNLDSDLIEQIQESIDIFHPELKETDACADIDDMEQQLIRLNDPETILDEVKSIVTQSIDGNFDSYPSYLIPLLQISWMVYNEDQSKYPLNIDDDLYDEICETIENINSLDEDAIDESEFSTIAIQKEIEIESNQNIQQETGAVDEDE